MACGYRSQVNESYWGFCEWKFEYPCLKWCNGAIYLPCGIKWCWIFPCGFTWCRIKIRYPCFKLCKGTLPYPCKKYREVEKWCYDFSSIGQNCIVFVELLSGCCGGREYKWKAACLGIVSSIQPGRRICFDSPLEDQGPCTSSSSRDLPPQHIGDDSVSAGGVDGVGGGQLKSNINTKLGTCKSCIRKSSVGFAFFLVLSIIAVFLFSETHWVSVVLYTLTILFGTLRFAHYVARKMQKQRRAIW